MRRVHLVRGKGGGGGVQNCVALNLRRARHPAPAPAPARPRPRPRPRPPLRGTPGGVRRGARRAAVPVRGVGKAEKMRVGRVRDVDRRRRPLTHYLAPQQREPFRLRRLRARAVSAPAPSGPPLLTAPPSGRGSPFPPSLLLHLPVSLLYTFWQR